MITNSIESAKKQNSSNFELSKILLKHTNTKLVKDNKPKQDRETMMYVGNSHPAHGNGSGHTTHHSTYVHHKKTHQETKIPEGYERCDHGCLCKKGTLHKHDLQNNMYAPNSNIISPHPAFMGGMGSPMGGMSPSPMMPMRKPPLAHNPVVSGMEKVGNGALGTVNQVAQMMGNWNQDFNNIAARKLLFLFY